MKKNIQIKNLDCAGCAAELEGILQKTDGITFASVSFVNQKVALEYEEEAALQKAVQIISSFEEVEIVSGKKKEIQIKNLDCAGCAAELEGILQKTDGIVSASVSFVTQKVALEYEEEAALQKAVQIISSFEEVEIVNGEKREIQIKGLDCAGCAAELEEMIQKLDGIEEASVSFVNQKITLVCTEEGYRRAVDTASHFEEVEVVTQEEKAKPAKTNLWSEHKRELLCIVLSVVLYLPALLIPINWLSYIFFAAAFLPVGIPVLIATVKNIAKGKFFDENALMTLGSLGAICLGEFAEGVAVMLLYQIGEFLQALAVGSSRRSISDLMDLKSETATLLSGGETKIVKPEELKVGDRILVKVGEKLPVDGKIVKGNTFLDTKSLSGEAMLKDASVGAEVLAGSINAGAVIEVEVLRVYAESAVAKILDLVENASSQKAKPEKFITSFARIYTPIVFFLALAIGVFVPTVIGLVTSFSGAVYADWLMRALKILVISCPCALIISVPLSYFGGIGTCARYGVLVKGATYLDTLAKVEIAAFDKTGTLTEGNFYLAEVHASDREQLLNLAAAAEANSNHPIALPFREINTPYTADDVREEAGKGIVCSVAGKELLVGNAKLMESHGIAYTAIDSVSTLVYVAYNGAYLGCVEIEDKIKEDSVEAIAAMKELGIRKTAVLTGDSRARAESVCARIGIDEIAADLLPNEKLERAKSFKTEGRLLYVGDGINDAPVMSIADVAVSMGKLGSDAAIEASDIVLVSDKLSAIPKGIKISRRTGRIVRFNICFSITVKVILMVLGGFNLIPLAVAVLGDVGVMLLAVLISLLTRLNVK